MDSTDLDLPMPTPTVPPKPLSSYKLISCDIYGTLIDWESSIISLLQKLTSRIPSSSSSSPNAIYRNSASGEGRTKLAGLFNHYEAALQSEQPSLLYGQLLTQVYLRMARDWDVSVDDEVKSEAENFGQSIGSWSAFADTVSACRRLSKHYRLVPISNVDRQSFGRTCAGPLKGIDFFAVYTAQDIGSYKPDLRNFEYLTRKVKEDAGVEKGEILHVAQSLFHDHRPAKQVGLSSVWINRQGAGMGAAEGVKALHEKSEVGYAWRFGSLGELADEVEKVFAEKGKR